MFDMLTDAVCAAALYVLGSKSTVGDQRAFGEYQGPAPTEDELRESFAEGFDVLLAGLDPEAHEEAVDTLIAGYLGEDPALVYDMRGHLDLLRRI